MMKVTLKRGDEVFGAMELEVGGMSAMIGRDKMAEFLLEGPDFARAGRNELRVACNRDGQVVVRSERSPGTSTIDGQDIGLDPVVVEPGTHQLVVVGIVLELDIQPR